VIGVACRPATLVADKGWEAGLGCTGLTGTVGVSRPHAGTGTPSAWAISAALVKRFERAISIAREIAISVLELTHGAILRRGWNFSGSAMRMVAVGGAWPASAW
jgi:hypothetical protein